MVFNLTAQTHNATYDEMVDSSEWWLKGGEKVFYKAWECPLYEDSAYIAAQMQTGGQNQVNQMKEMKTSWRLVFNYDGSVSSSIRLDLGAMDMNAEVRYGLWHLNGDTLHLLLSIPLDEQPENVLQGLRESLRQCNHMRKVIDTSFIRKYYDGYLNNKKKFDADFQQNKVKPMSLTGACDDKAVYNLSLYYILKQEYQGSQFSLTPIMSMNSMLMYFETEEFNLPLPDYFLPTVNFSTASKQ